MAEGERDIKTIAVDLDDTLNNFTVILKQTEFKYDNSYGLTQEEFNQYIHKLQNKEKDDNELMSTKYSYFRYNIHEQCHKRAIARPDGIEFMQWLRKNNWRIVICTYRDLRKANDYTKEWLNANHIPWDYVMGARNKIVFCKLWGIKHLVDDDNFNISYGESYGVNVYYPILTQYNGIQQTSGRGFNAFDEVKKWIQE